MENMNCSNKNIQVAPLEYTESPIERMTKYQIEAMSNMFSQTNYDLLVADSKENLLKQLKKFKKSHKVINISFSSNTKYSKFFDREYTEYNVLVQYI